MTKPLCEQKKLLKTDVDSYLKLILDPKFICRKCGRVAHSKNLVCRASKIKGAKGASGDE